MWGVTYNYNYMLSKANCLKYIARPNNVRQVMELKCVEVLRYLSNYPKTRLHMACIVCGVGILEFRKYCEDNKIRL